MGLFFMQYEFMQSFSNSIDASKSDRLLTKCFIWLISQQVTRVGSIIYNLDTKSITVSRHGSRYKLKHHIIGATNW